MELYVPLKPTKKFEYVMLYFRQMTLTFAAVFFVVFLSYGDSPKETVDSPLVYIDTAFENASPLYWEVGEGGDVNVFLLYDHQRNSTNRAAGHWHFRVEAVRNAQLTIILNNFNNIYNGRHSTPAKEESVTFVSVDGKRWSARETDYLEGNRLRFELQMQADSMYVARLEPYRLSDLAKLLNDIQGRPNVRIEHIGKTLEGRPLEIVSIGHLNAPHNLLLRARAHPWEPGGNWVIEGLIRRLLEDDAFARACLDQYAVHILPMANKDGVARGLTRFNLAGMDLNRHWDTPSDPSLAPENAALERWIERSIQQGCKPDLMIDFHNDQIGRLHIARPNGDLETYLAQMKTLEALLFAHTWFREGTTGSNYRNPGSIGEGLLERYSIHACIHELNANWIAGLGQPPNSEGWKLYGAQLCEVFRRYFGE